MFLIKIGRTIKTYSLALVIEMNLIDSGNPAVMSQQNVCANSGQAVLYMFYPLWMMCVIEIEESVGFASKSVESVGDFISIVGLSRWANGNKKKRLIQMNLKCSD